MAVSVSRGGDGAGSRLYHFSAGLKGGIIRHSGPRAGILFMMARFKIPACAGMTVVFLRPFNFQVAVRPHDWAALRARQTRSTGRLATRVKILQIVRELQLPTLITRWNAKHIAVAFTEMGCRNKTTGEGDIDDRFTGL